MCKIIFELLEVWRHKVWVGFDMDFVKIFVNSIFKFIIGLLPSMQSIEVLHYFNVAHACRQRLTARKSWLFFILQTIAAIFILTRAVHARSLINQGNYPFQFLLTASTTR